MADPLRPVVAGEMTPAISARTMNALLEAARQYRTAGRGKGGADMRMISTVAERTPGETEVTITSQVNVMGILAQFGRGMIQDVSDQMFGTFVAAARAELEKPETTAGPGGPAGGTTTSNFAATPQAAPPVEVLSLGSAVAGRAAARVVTKPVVWLGIAIILLLFSWWWMR